MEDEWAKLSAAIREKREIKKARQQEFLKELKNIVASFDNSNIDEVNKTILEIQGLLERFPRNTKQL